MALESDLRSEERTPVHLPARVSTDGEKFRRAVVTNLSARGAYVEGEIELPERARVLVDVVLGHECVRLRGRVAHPDEWSETARRIGIGVEFVLRTKQATAAIEAVLLDPPPVLSLSESGALRWPLDPASGGDDSPSDAAGLSFLAGVSWEPVLAVSEETGPVEEPGTGADLEAHRAWVGAVVPGLLAEEVDVIRMAYRGHCLGPTEGLAREALEGMSEQDLEPIALQTVLIGLLREMDWRADRLDAARAMRLAKIAAIYREAADRDGTAGFPELVPFVAQLDALREGWAALGAPNATRVTAQREVEDQDWIAGGRGVAAPKHPEPAAKPQRAVPAAAPESSARRRSKLWMILSVGLPVIVVLASLGYTIAVFRAVDVSDPLTEVGADEFVDLFDLERLRVEGDRLVAVPMDWSDYNGSDLERRVNEFCLRANAAGFAGAQLTTDTGHPLARCAADRGTIL